MPETFVVPVSDAGEAVGAVATGRGFAWLTTSVSPGAVAKAMENGGTYRAGALWGVVGMQGSFRDGEVIK
jgi:hypothetical protein